MKDILGRELKENDIVVVKGNGSNFSDTKQKGMEVGIVRGKSVRTLTCSRNPQDKFLVVNPSEEELKIKETILNLIELQKSSKKKRKKVDSSEVGGVYVCNPRSKHKYVYLGYGTFTVYKNKKLEAQYTRHFYVYIRNRMNDLKKSVDIINIDKEIEFECTYYYSNPDFLLKNYKTVIEKLGTIIVPDKFSKTITRNWSSYSDGIETNHSDIYEFFWEREV